MGAPRRNVELKARDRDPTSTLARCRALRAEDRGQLVQRDTYFAVADGALKLREQTPGDAHLIAYSRPRAAHARESRYRIVPVPDAPALTAVLAAALGVRGTVTKRRHLLLWRSVRIHLDTVDGLGTFVELEAVAAPESDLTAERRLTDTLTSALEIQAADLIADGYAQLLFGSRPPGAAPTPGAPDDA